MSERGMLCSIFHYLLHPLKSMFPHKKERVSNALFILLVLNYWLSLFIKIFNSSLVSTIHDDDPLNIKIQNGPHITN